MIKNQYCKPKPLSVYKYLGENKDQLVFNRGNYEIIGWSNELAPELVEEKFKVPFKQYIKLLNEKDITVNYSDHSDFWLVVILTER